MGTLDELTNKELEDAIYEAIHEMHDARYLKKLMNERKRRNLEQ